MVEFYQRFPGETRSLGILAGSFNPLTVAHLELARAAENYVDEVLLVVPSALPHKQYLGATLDQRVAMLASAGLPARYSVAATDQSLFVDIARALREYYDRGTRFSFVCGRDAAERVLHWDYGRSGVVAEMLQEFELLVAPRKGDYEAPAEFRGRIQELKLSKVQDHISSSEVRARIARGEPWEHLVPGPIVDQVREIYR